MLKSLLIERGVEPKNAEDVVITAHRLADGHAQGHVVAPMYVVLVVRVAANGQVHVAARVDSSNTVTPSASDDGVWPNSRWLVSVQSMLEGRGTDIDALLEFITHGTQFSVDHVGFLREVFSEPYNWVTSVEQQDGEWRLTARIFPVRKGKGGAAIWSCAPGLGLAFYPLVFEFGLTRGKNQPILDFHLMPRRSGRRPFAEIGPYDLFHGPSDGLSQLFMMRAANVITRGVVSADYRTERFAACIGTEVTKTKGIVLASEPIWRMDDGVVRPVVVVI